MTIEDKISQFLPSFLKRYDGNKDSAGEGTLERYQKMLASEIDEHFLESTDNLHENTKAVTMPVKFLPYEEDLRGTLPLVFEFAPIISVIPLDETGLIFDFDFKKIDKMVLTGAQKLTSFTDRGIVLAQPNLNIAPTLTNDGLYFNGDFDFMTLRVTTGSEIWIVCNNLDGLTFDNAGVLLYNNDIYFYGLKNTSSITSNSPTKRINNINTVDFAPLNKFKSISQSVSNSNEFITVCSLSSIGQYFWNGNIKRILLFATPRTEAQRTQLQAYLAQKYSL